MAASLDVLYAANPVKRKKKNFSSYQINVNAELILIVIKGDWIYVDFKKASDSVKEGH